MTGAFKTAIFIAFCFLVARPFVTRAQRAAANGEWRWYGGDAAGTKYSPLDQINAANVNQLQIAWRWKREGFGPRPDSNWQVTPLMVGGALYFTAGMSRAAVAVDAASGDTLWTYLLDEGVRGTQAPRATRTARERSGNGPQNSTSKSLKKIDDNTIEVTNKKNGKVTNTMKVVVAKDGKSRTNEAAFTNAKGVKVHNIIFFDRK